MTWSRLFSSLRFTVYGYTGDLGTAPSSYISLESFPGMSCEVFDEPRVGPGPEIRHLPLSWMD